MAILDNLQAYLKLDESSGTRADSSGNGRNATMSGTVGTAAGKVNSLAARFTGNGNFLEIADNAGISGGQDFSIACWIFLDTGAYNQSYGVFEKWPTSGNGDYGCYIAGSNIAFYNHSSEVSVSPAPSDNAWHFYVFKYTHSSGRLELRVDNGTPSVISSGTTSADGNGRLTLGSFSYVDSYYPGRMCEFAFWNRIIDSSEESNLWNGGAGKTWPLVSGGGTSILRQMMQHHR